MTLKQDKARRRNWYKGLLMGMRSQLKVMEKRDELYDSESVTIKCLINYIDVLLHDWIPYAPIKAEEKNDQL